MSLVECLLKVLPQNETVGIPEDILVDKNGGVNVAKDAVGEFEDDFVVRDKEYIVRDFWGN